MSRDLFILSLKCMATKMYYIESRCIYENLLGKITFSNDYDIL